MGINGPVPTPPPQHGQWTLGRRHPLSRGEESESNYLNCPGGPKSRESQQDCRGQVASCPGSGSSCCQASNFLSAPSAHTLSTFSCLAPYEHTSRHRLGKLGQQTETSGLLSHKPCRCRLMGDKSLPYSTARDQNMLRPHPGPSGYGCDGPVLRVQIQRHSHPNASTQAKLLGLAVSYKVSPSQSTVSPGPKWCRQPTHSW